MIGFGETLDTIDFDALVAVARARLPGLAPEWTDYNIHDPGITLVELMAWVADSQVYALARNRQDERLAMARLLGGAPRGAVPATGTVYPLDDIEAVAEVAERTRLIAGGGIAPRIETLTRVSVLPVEIESIRVTGPGFVADHIQANRRGGARFAAFGPTIMDGAELRIRLRALAGHVLPVDAPLRLSIGFRVEDGNDDADVAEIGTVAAFDGASGAALEILLDTSQSLQRSGALVVALPPDPAHADAIELVLRPTPPTALMPLLVGIAPNALPVIQRATLTEQPRTGNGRPGQTIDIEPAALFPSDEAADGRVWWLTDAQAGGRAIGVAVEDGTVLHDWAAGALDRAGPESRRYALDERIDGSRVSLRFGNGINGRIPGESQQILIGLEMSCGRGGEVRSSVEWTLSGHRGHWQNWDPIAGARDAQSADDALDEASDRLEQSRLLATDAQLRAAVAALPAAFGIERIDIEAGWERGRRMPQVPATRTLLVTRRDHAGETAVWLRAIAARLRPRIALGERLLVAAPVYRSFGLRVGVGLAAGHALANVAAAIRTDLVARLDGTGGHPLWPMSREIDATAIAGWIRRMPGVARVQDVTLLGEAGAPLDRDRLGIRRGELPRLSDMVDVRLAKVAS